MARAAIVHDPHDYVGVGHGHPCEECGSGKDAFIHSEDGARTAATVVQAVDEGQPAEAGRAG